MKKIAIGAVFLLAAATYGSQAAAAGTLTFVCTNVQSGASWTVTADDVKGTVGPYKATISAHWISWYDMARAHYFDLDRRTGELTDRYASSVGGVILHHNCRAG
jgi:hypothetical protein